MNLIRDRFSKWPLVGLALGLLAAAAAIPAQAQTRNINFPNPVTFQSSVGPTITAMAVADVNGDGNLDIVNVDSGQNGGILNLDVMLGKGDGTFQVPITLNYDNGTLSSAGFAIAVGDFNGDHIPDVAVWGLGTPNSDCAVEILLGNGNGTFTIGGTFNVPNSRNFNSGTSSLVAADVNGDGKLDLVALTPVSGVFVLIGKGDGTFQAPVNYPTINPNGPNMAVAVGDLNGDGHPDLVIGASQGINVLLNTGTGTFGAASYYQSTTSGFSAGQGIAIGDVNGDKKPDVVVSSNFATGFQVMLNSGTGTFTTGTFVAVPNLGTADNLVLGDINNDKKLDVVIPDQQGSVYTFFGNGKGAFTTGPAYPLAIFGGNQSVPQVALGDFNNDGTLDLLDDAGFQINQTYLNTVSLGRGDGSFQTGQFTPFAAPVQYENIAVADFNGGGIPDVVAQANPNGSIAVVLGTSHGALTTKQIVTSVCTNTFTYGIAAGDVNGDGKADVVAVFGGGSGTCDHMAAVLLGLGTGKFKAPVLYPTGAGSNAQEEQVYLVDVNGDGKLDIITSNSDGSISVLVNKGNGTYAAPNLITSLSAFSSFDNQLTFADFNRDGKLDIAVVANIASGVQSVWVLPGNGNGTFGAPIATSISSLPFGQPFVAAGDFNGDGKPDLVLPFNSSCTQARGSSYAFLKGNGDGTFTPGTLVCIAPATNPGPPVVADFNSDGKLDVVIPSASGGYGPTILQGKGDGTFAGSQLFYSGGGSGSAAIADFNGDGMLDIGLADYNTDMTVMLNATQPVSVSPLSMSFKAQTVGTKSKGQTVIITNDQTSALAITSVTLAGAVPGDYAATSACKSSLKPGWDCTITVTFTPTATGTRTATLNIKDGVGTQTVQLSGTGK